MSYSFKLRQEAAVEFSDAYVWYEEQREGLGDLFEKAVYAKLNLICNHPLHYRKSYKNYHEALINKFPFLIIYTIDESKRQIVIFAIFHTSRNPKAKFKKKRAKR